MKSLRRKPIATALAAVLFTFALSGVAAAQDTAGGTGGNTQSGGTTTAERTDDNHTDYGWIGLAGLLGLAGLMKKPKEVHTHETRVVPPTGTR